MLAEPGIEQRCNGPARGATTAGTSVLTARGLSYAFYAFIVEGDPYVYDCPSGDALQRVIPLG
ncbi:MAG: hypothetical protein P8176_15015 [Gammaproteobacteria bacterium]